MMRSIVAGAAVDAALFGCLTGFALVFVVTGSAASLLAALMVGSGWARDVGNRPGKPRF